MATGSDENAGQPDSLWCLIRFRRARSPRFGVRGLGDEAIRTDAYLPGRLQPGTDPERARCVYAEPEGTIDIVPGVGSMTFVTRGADGQSTSAQTTTELAVDHELGHTRWNREDGYTFVEVLPVGVRMSVVTAVGNEIDAPVNSNRAYWFGVRDAIRATWTAPDGIRYWKELREPRIGNVRRPGES